MITHAQIWYGIDQMAARKGLSASGLAKGAGLDQTTFNKSKRVAPDGRERWPSTESLVRALAVTPAWTLAQFEELIFQKPPTERTPEPKPNIAKQLMLMKKQLLIPGYHHVYALEYAVKSEKKDASDVTHAMARAALLDRADLVTDGDWREAYHLCDD